MCTRSPSKPCTGQTSRKLPSKTTKLSIFPADWQTDFVKQVYLPSSVIRRKSTNYNINRAVWLESFFLVQLVAHRMFTAIFIRHGHAQKTVRERRVQLQCKCISSHVLTSVMMSHTSVGSSRFGSIQLPVNYLKKTDT